MGLYFAVYTFRDSSGIGGWWWYRRRYCPLEEEEGGDDDDDDMKLAGWLTDGRPDRTLCGVVSPDNQSRNGDEETRRCRGENSPTRSQWNVSLWACLVLFFLN